MRRDWDARARADAMYHVDANRGRWTVDEFYARGPALVAEMVDPVLQALHTDPANKRVLEIGCGMGRLFAGLAARFGDVWGVDISPEMVALGRAHCPADATWLVGDGHSLGGVADGSVDHVLSFEVLQHIPDKAVVHSYLAETWRVLRLGGTFQLHLRSSSDSTGQALVRALPRPLRVAVAGSLRAARLLRAQGDIDTWLGCIVPPAEAMASMTTLGFRDVSVLPDEVHRRAMGYWLIGRKAASTSRAQE
jgi:SAM-dependent methyltransferase